MDNASGRIISFLDDDDMFEKEKLEDVLKNFISDDNVIRMRNRYSIINRNGLFVNYSNTARETADILYCNSEKRDLKKISLMLKRGYDFNLSCISIKKEVVLTFMSQLRLIESSDDSFMFFISLFSDGDVLARGAILNRYRMHDDSSIAKMGSLDKMLDKNASEFLRQIRAFNILQTLSNDPYVSEAIVESILNRKALYRIVATDVKTTNVSLLEVLKLVIHHKSIPFGYLLKLIVANVLINLNRPLVRKIYRYRTEQTYKRVTRVK